MIILVSACLLGENCKYDGGSNRNEWLLKLGEEHTLIPVCPEMLGGLPAPRSPSEIVGGIVMGRDGRSYDSAFRNGARAAFEIAKESGAELAILQSRSPSCGVSEIYDGTFSGAKIPGSGVFASLLKQEGFRVLDIADAEREFSSGGD